MAKVFTLARREFAGLFFSLIGYVVMAVYLGWLGLWFAATVLVPGQVADMRWMFTMSHWALILVIPLMTMSLLADEYASGRIEMLRTSPITDFQILMGKYLGALGFFAMLVFASLVYVLVLAVFGRPNYGAVISSYMGVLLLGMLAVAIGLFFSSISRYQIVAALLGILTMFVITIGLDVVNFLFQNGAIPVANFAIRWARDASDYLAVRPHLEQFAKGIVETRDLTYFVSGAFLFLVLTYLVLESRKWR